MAAGAELVGGMDKEGPGRAQANSQAREAPGQLQTSEKAKHNKQKQTAEEQWPRITWKAVQMHM